MDSRRSVWKNRPFRIQRCKYDRGEKKLSIFIFFIDITKVTEVQYAILIAKMDRLTAKLLNTMTLKQTIMSHSRFMY
jgi:hypothetical protein